GLQAFQARIDAKPRRYGAERQRQQRTGNHQRERVADDEGAEPVRRERAAAQPLVPPQHRREKGQREDAGEQNPGADESTKIVQRREVDEEQGEERRGRRELREDHAEGGSGHPPPDISIWSIVSILSV